MKRLFFILSLIVCLGCLPMVGLAATAEEEQAYQDAIADNWKTMLTDGIELDKISAENKASLLKWLGEENPPEEAKKLVDSILKLQEEQEDDQENMEPYTKAKKACDKKLNAEGANAALENLVRIQKDRIEDQKELKELWKKVDKLLKG